jgi:hypothetical protein
MMQNKYGKLKKKMNKYIWEPSLSRKKNANENLSHVLLRERGL